MQYLIAVVHYMCKLAQSKVTERQVEVSDNQQILDCLLLVCVNTTLHLQPKYYALVLDHSMLVPASLWTGEA